MVLEGILDLKDVTLSVSDSLTIGVPLIPLDPLKHNVPFLWCIEAQCLPCVCKWVFAMLKTEDIYIIWVYVIKKRRKIEFCKNILKARTKNVLSLSDGKGRARSQSSPSTHWESWNRGFHYFLHLPYVLHICFFF